MAKAPESPRTLRARLGALTVHSRHDSRDLSSAGRAAFLRRFEREVDPDGVLDPEERTRRAEYAKKAYFTRLQLKSAVARRKNRAKKAARAARRERSGR
jgi:hypothetical protein